MSTDALNARDLTRRLIARAAQAETLDGSAPPVYAAAESACRQLSRSLGPTGFNALLRRALAHAEVEHPLLKDVHLGRPTEPFLGGMTQIAATHSEAAISAALEAMLETLFGLLGRLIGNDMVPRLVEQGAHAGTHDDEDVK
jgi:hypothetical protein